MKFVKYIVLEVVEHNDKHPLDKSLMDNLNGTLAMYETRPTAKNLLNLLKYYRTFLSVKGGI